MKGKSSKEFKKLYQLTKSNTPCVNYTEYSIFKQGNQIFLSSLRYGYIKIQKKVMFYKKYGYKLHNNAIEKDLV